MEFVISYDGKGELVAAAVNVTLSDVALGDVLLQTHAVQFKVNMPTQCLSLSELHTHKIQLVFFLDAAGCSQTNCKGTATNIRT